MNSLIDIATCITCYYQPIFSLRKREVIGYEALSRFIMEGVAVSYTDAVQPLSDRDRIEIDWECRKRCVENYTFKDKKLFLNINPKSIMSPRFGRGITEEIIRASGLSPSQVVLEITESEKVSDIEDLKRIIHYYKEVGFNVALDDFGLGYNTIEFILSLTDSIDYIKLPRQLIKGISRSFMRYQLAETFKEVSHSLGVKVVAEGVENKEDLESVFSLGIDLVQGYLIAKPAPSAELQNLDIKSVVCNDLKTSLSMNGIDILSEIIKPLKAFKVRKDVRFKDITALLEETDPSYKDNYILLEIEGAIKLLFNVWEYARLSANPLRFNLLYNKNILWFMDSAMRNDCPNLIREVSTCEVVDRTELTSLIGTAFYFEKNSREEVVLVSEQGKLNYYLCRDDVYESLYKVFYRKKIHTNPLTGLPANLEIERVVEELIESEEHFIQVYLDIDNFKPFNDTFGFYLGDVMIKKTAFILNAFLRDNFKERHFLGHIGGDDFVFLITDTDMDSVVRKLPELLHELERSTAPLYPKEVQSEGYFHGKDREGRIQKFPVASFSLAVVDGKGKTSLVEISKVSARLKKKAKAFEGSAIAVENHENIISLYQNF